MSEAERTVSHVLDNGLVRAGSVVAIVLFFAASSWQAASAYNAITAKLQQIESVMETRNGVIQDIAKIRDDIADLKRTDVWTRIDMRRLCRENELKNPGWKCGATE